MVELSPSTTETKATLSPAGRYLVLFCAFFGWLFAGFHMSITQLGAQAAAVDLLGQRGFLDVSRYRELTRKYPQTGVGKKWGDHLSDEEKLLMTWQSAVSQWFAWYQCSFLFGAASGGLVFGRLGDRIGRAKAMSLSILTYSLLAGVAYFSASPMQLAICWFFACLGVGGMWPNGVALVSEAWSGMSRPMVAGVIGTSANIGIFLFSSLATQWKITPDDWRWIMLVGSIPSILGVFSFAMVPESPRWLKSMREQSPRLSAQPTHGEIFRPPLLKITLLGILLATIPVIGGWSTANWMIPWAENAGLTATPPNPYLKAQVLRARAITGIAGSLLGGWIAGIVGRKLTYAGVSAACLVIAQYTFWFVTPTEQSFLFCVSALGFFSGIYFGWLPLCLPEMFPTRVRSTGAGVSFNFGRIATAVTVLTAGMMMTYVDGNYAKIGRLTSLFFVLGIFAIYLAPDTSQRELAD